jgi:hypothetical protein
MKKRWNTLLSLWLTVAVLAFSFLGIIWHDETRHGSCSPVHGVAMPTCPDHSSMEMVDHHLDFFLGVMQATDGFGLAFLALFGVFWVAEWHSTLLFRQHFLSRFRACLRWLFFLGDELTAGLKKYFSWLSVTHAFFPMR